jgi:hypothetical protein
MAIVVTKTVKAKVNTGLDNKLKAAVDRAITRRSNRIKGAALKAAQKVIIKHVKNHRVYRAILGHYAGFETGKDLQAEFGLTSDKAKRAMTAMLQILSDSAQVFLFTTKRAKTVASANVFLKISVLNPSKYESQLKYGALFKYKSSIIRHPLKLKRKKKIKKLPEKNRIDWMKWLLEASDGIRTIRKSIPSINRYAINYDLSPRQRLNSRSGRAVMVPLRFGVTGAGFREVDESGTISGRVTRITEDKEVDLDLEGKPQLTSDSSAFGEEPYKYPEYAKPEVGRNFIEEISFSKAFISDLNKAVKEAVKAAVAK